VLKVLMDARLPKKSSDAEFAKTLIDEFVVSDLQQFRRSIEYLMPYSTRVESFSLGCIWVEFGMYGRPQLKSETARSLLRKDDVEGLSKPWAQLKTRFHVESLELNYK
jgi:hypothetical protein